MQELKAEKPPESPEGSDPATRLMRRVAGSDPSGDSGGFSAFSSCILFNETDQVRELEWFHEIVIGAALPRFLGDVAIARDDDVRNRFCLCLSFQCRAKGRTVHPFDGEVGEDH